MITLGKERRKKFSKRLRELLLLYNDEDTRSRTSADVEKFITCYMPKNHKNINNFNDLETLFEI